MKPLIKICGINDFNVLQQLVSMDNINYLGFIFYEKSVRNVSPEFLERVKEFEFKDKHSEILFENYKKDQPGGTGESFDWSLINSVKDLDIKIILSGGINCENVDNAIDINPWCLDINSGVESSPGIKNIDLIKQLLDKINI